MNLHKSSPSTLWKDPCQKAAYQNSLGISEEAQTQGRKHSGIWTSLLLAYLFLDLVRPSFVWHFPKIISILLFGAWLFLPNKKWNRQVICFFLIIVLLVIDIPLAINSYDALWKSYGMLILLVGVCVPLFHFIDSLQRLGTVLSSILISILYIGVYAIFHQGFGPAGAAGAQDENYVAAALSMALPICYFWFFSSKGSFKKLYFAMGIAICVAGAVVGMSRGGFLGLLSVFVYSLWHSPRKWLGVALGIIATAVMLAVAGEQYWKDIGTITDTSEGTADMRLEFWAIAVRMFLHHPITGVGPGNFIWQIENFETMEQVGKFGHSIGGSAVTHSLYFELLAEWGLIGVILFGAILYQNFLDLGFVSRRSQELIDRLTTAAGSIEQSDEYLARVENLLRTRCFCHAITASLIACLVTSAFLSTLYFSYFWLLTALTITLKEVFFREIELVAAKPIAFST